MAPLTNIHLQLEWKRKKCRNKALITDEGNFYIFQIVIFQIFIIRSGVILQQMKF